MLFLGLDFPLAADKNNFHSLTRELSLPSAAQREPSSTSARVPLHHLWLIDSRADGLAFPGPKSVHKYYGNNKYSTRWQSPTMGHMHLEAEFLYIQRIKTWVVYPRWTDTKMSWWFLSTYLSISFRQAQICFRLIECRGICVPSRHRRTCKTEEKQIRINMSCIIMWSWGGSYLKSGHVLC